MSDKLAIIQSEETIKEINDIISKVDALNNSFLKTVELSRSINTMFNAGSFTEYKSAVEKAKNVSDALSVSEKNIMQIEKERISLQEKLKNATASQAKENAGLKAQLQDINIKQRQNATATNENIGAYKRLSAQTAIFKREAKDLASQMFLLEKSFKKGELNAKDYQEQLKKLSKQYVTAEARAKGYDKAIKGIDSKVGDRQRNVGNYGNSLAGIAGSLGGSVGNITGALATGGAIGAGIATVEELIGKLKELVTEFYNTTKTLDSLKLSFETVFEAGAGERFEYLKETANKYGLEIESLAGSYKSFSAAVKDTNLEGGKADYIFETVSKASAKLGLSSEQTQGALLALQQMISKGNVQAEELRGQLGERIPGAFRIFADSMGVSQQELNKLLKDGKVLAEDTLPKFAEQLEKVYNLDAVGNIDTVVAAENRRKNAWLEFVDGVNNSSGAFENASKGWNKMMADVWESLTPDKATTGIENEITKVATLTEELRKNWFDREKSSEIIKELNASYPELLGGLDRENLTIGYVNERLVDYIKLQNERLVSAKKGAEIADVEEEIAKRTQAMNDIIADNIEIFSQMPESIKRATYAFIDGKISYDDFMNTIENTKGIGGEAKYTIIKMALAMEDLNVGLAGSDWGFAFTGMQGLRDRAEKAKKEQELFNAELAKKNPSAIFIQNNKDMINSLSDLELRTRLTAIQAKYLNSILAGGVMGTISEGLMVIEQTSAMANAGQDKKQVSSGASSSTAKQPRARRSSGGYSGGSRRGSSLSGQQKDYIKELEAQRDTELAVNEDLYTNLKISELEYVKESERINMEFLNKKLEYLNRKKQLNAEEKRDIAKTTLEISKLTSDSNKKLFEIEQKRLKDSLEAKQKEAENAKNQVDLNDFSSETEKATAEIDFNNQSLENYNEYYNDLMDLAKTYYQDTTDLAKEANDKIGELQDKQIDDLKQGLEAFRRDQQNALELSNSKVSSREAEAEYNILNDKRLSDAEKEYKISMLQKQSQIAINEEKIKSLEIDIERLKIQDSIGKGLDLEQEKALIEAQINLNKLKSENIGIKTDIDKTENPALAKKKKELEQFRDFISKGFSDLGMGDVSDSVGKAFDAIFDKTDQFKEKYADMVEAVGESSARLAVGIQAGVEVLGGYASKLVDERKEKTIASIDEEQKASEDRTNEEIKQIESRIEWINTLGDLTAEQEAEKQALEEKKKVIQAQQEEKDKQYKIRKARAEQKADAQKAIIGGIVGGAKALPNFYLAAASIAFGLLSSAMILAKNPVPQYYVGTKNAKEGLAWTDERGAEIRTDKNDNVLDWGSNKGARLVKLNAGDKIYTAPRTKKIIQDLKKNNVSLDLQKKLAFEAVNTQHVYREKQVDEIRLANMIGEKFDSTFKKYDKVHIFEQGGYRYKQKGGQLPTVIEKVKEKNIIIKNMKDGND